MRAVLGIDAAWTLTQPSGVAVATQLSSGWRVMATASSYQRLHALADPRLLEEPRPSGSLPDAPALLASASVLCEAPVNLVAIDMPLARTPIVGRRVSDSAVSRAYGGRKCGTHTPKALRPGRLSDRLRQSFDRAGYPLLTNMIAPVRSDRGLSSSSAGGTCRRLNPAALQSVEGPELLASRHSDRALRALVSTME